MTFDAEPGLQVIVTLRTIVRVPKGILLLDLERPGLHVRVSDDAKGIFSQTLKLRFRLPWSPTRPVVLLTSRVLTLVSVP